MNKTKNQYSNNLKLFFKNMVLLSNTIKEQIIVGNYQTE